MKKEKSYWVYILANKSKTLYIGVTDNLLRRLFEHKNKTNSKSFTSRYNISKLAYLEETNDVTVAIQREKQLKSYKRDWKVELIERENPNWEDLSEDWF